MERFLGLDVSQRLTSVCILDARGGRMWRGKCATDPAVIEAVASDAAIVDGAGWWGYGYQIKVIELPYGGSNNKRYAFGAEQVALRSYCYLTSGSPNPHPMHPLGSFNFRARRDDAMWRRSRPMRPTGL